MESARHQIEGFKELQDLLKKLPRRVQDRVLAGALRSGASVLRKEAVSRLMASSLKPDVKKRIRRAMKAKASRSKMIRRGFVVGSVQLEMTGDAKNDPYWWRWLDQGTEERYRKSGAPTGKIEGANIFRPAFDDSSSAATDVVTQRISALALREIEKMKAKK